MDIWRNVKVALGVGEGGAEQVLSAQARSCGEDADAMVSGTAAPAGDDVDATSLAAVQRADDPAFPVADASLAASGKICYMQFYALDDRAITDVTVRRAEELAAAGGQAEAIIADFRTSENFLYGDGLHFPAKRYAFDGRRMTIRDIPIESSFVVVSLYPETGICQIDACFTLGQTSVDDWVFMRQIQGARGVRFDLDALECDSIAPAGSDDVADQTAFPLHVQMSVPELCEQILADLSLNPIGQSTAYLVELNQLGDANTPDGLTYDQQAALYGVLTGDEGWRFVPRELVRQRMDNSWGTRDFVKAVVFSNNFLLLNFNRQPRGNDYMEGQREIGGHYYGGVNDYFVMDASTAGVNHGIFFSVETAMIIKAIGSRLLAARPTPTGSALWFLSGEMGRSKQYRGELIRALGRLENIGISELGELDALIIGGLNVQERVRSVRDLLELVESELDLAYQTNTNRMVTFLTVVGLLLAVVEVVLSLPMFS